jgi:hypothetical protein
MSEVYEAQLLRIQVYSLAHRYSINAATAEILAFIVFALGVSR